MESELYSHNSKELNFGKRSASVMLYCMMRFLVQQVRRVGKKETAADRKDIEMSGVSFSQPPSQQHN